ncbi:cell wall-binding repeat-containing protein [Clostridium tetanomorphum]|uniref:Cell wall-binding repeat-containing protein n=1 Tax=Clostridium tetanomorphum TaxID=1553 RepID=A0A923E9I2_CLOTT|nr:cell wall-binding repeat-containing protein [Clostridium tetanomorphum]MBC2396365.1 cell wall-binding repeat-containing protein [Clostridium tetanomorphum]NRZ96703.1 putative cell wall-binding protein [Clostridium tetanomorphum]
MHINVGKISIILIAIMVIFIGPTAKAAPAQVTRIGEEDRYATASKIATTNWTSSKDVILVSGEGYADAVSASTLAKQLNAPILLTKAKELNSNTQEALNILKPKNIYIIGGEASVSTQVRKDLRNNYNLIELKGRNRYETNIAVARQLLDLEVKSDNVLLVGGNGFSDALSVAPIAAAKGQILLLGNNDMDIMEPIFQFIKEKNCQVIVIGTEYVINSNMYEALQAVYRIQGGKDRFETNLNILHQFKDDLKSDKLFIANASGQGYADALVGGALAGNTSSPLVLVHDDDSLSTEKAIDYIKDTAIITTDLSAIGGKGVISDNTISQINNIMASSKNGTPTVKSIETNGLNQIKIVFNTEINKDMAERIENYQINGVNLGENDSFKASANLQEDNKTVLINLTNPFSQHRDVIVTVKSSILDKELNSNISKFEKKVIFEDTNEPNLKSIIAIGNKKLIIKFSQPIRMKMNDLDKMKINGESITELSLNTTLTNFNNSSDNWTDTLELYFHNEIKAGVNIFEIPKGISGVQFDNAAGFPIQKTEASFNVKEIDKNIRIIDIKGDTTTGTIYVTYNRAMDRETALNGSNYNINGAVCNLGEISFKEGSKDRVIKIEEVGSLLLNGGDEILIINNIKDAYGNKVEENMGTTFTIPKDRTKPKIIATKMIDSRTMRIKFNKNVLSTYATNKSNYTLIDSDGIDITYKIHEIKEANGVALDNISTYDIKFTKDNALTEPEYILRVKDIIDINSMPNVMEEYNGIVYGVDDIAPMITAIVKKLDNPQKVVVFFSENMDKESISNASNYYYVNGVGDTKVLPNNAEIFITEDCKSVVICFPSNYILDKGKYENYIIKIGVTNVKDRSGNNLPDIAHFDNISTIYTGGPSIVQNTLKVYYDGDDIKAEILLKDALNTLNINDFKIAGQRPDKGSILGRNIILTFADGKEENVKINAIKKAGVNVTLEIVNPNSADIAGRKLEEACEQAYNVQLEPKTIFHLWTVDSSFENNSVTVVFDKNIDSSIQSLYEDDFIFTNERTGGKLKVQAVTVKENKIIYKFEDASINSGDIINVYANSNNFNVNIRSEKDLSGNFSKYSPSLDDLKVRKLIVK